MLYAKMAGIAVFAFGFAALMIVLFSGKQDSDPQVLPGETGVQFEDLDLNQAQIASELKKLIAEDTGMVAFSRPEKIIASPYQNQIAEWFDWSEKARQVASELEWAIGFFGTGDPPEPLQSLNARISRLRIDGVNLQAGALRFLEPVSDNGAIRRLKRLSGLNLECDQKDNRLFLKTGETNGLYFVRLDQKTFLFGSSSVLDGLSDSEQFVDNSVYEWATEFESETPEDDLLLVGEFFPFRSWLGAIPDADLRYSIARSPAHLHFNFSQTWILVCQLHTAGSESTDQLQVRIQRAWHRMIGLLMGQIRYPEPEEDIRAKKNALKLVKSVKIGNYSQRVIVGLPDTHVEAAIEFLVGSKSEPANSPLER